MRHHHVPFHEAAALAQTPEHYLLNAAMIDPRDYLTLARRRPLSTAVRARVVEQACLGPDLRLHGAPVVTGEEWLGAALAIETLTAAELARVAGVVFAYCRANPAAVVARVLAHPSMATAAAGALLDGVWLLGRAHSPQTVLAPIDAAGWPATLTWQLHRGHRRAKGPSAGTLLTYLSGAPALHPVLDRLRCGFTGTLEELLETAAAIATP